MLCTVACRDEVTHVTQSLLLGGGFGFLTGQHGLVIDNLLQVRPLSSPDRHVVSS